MSTRGTAPSVRPAILLTCMILAACGRAPSSSSSDGSAKLAPATPAVDEYQAMAFAAGSDLIGKPAPKLNFNTIDGRTIVLGQARARPIYLKFWATWCVTCRQQMTPFKADYAKYGKDMDIVAVNTGVNDDLASVQAYRRDVQLPMPIAIDDGRLGDALHLKVTPQHAIIGRDNIIRYVGHLEDARLHAELQAAIADRPSPEAARTIQPAEVPALARDTFQSVQGPSVRIGGPAAGRRRLIYFLSPWCETYLKTSRPSMAQACEATRKALTRVSGAGGADVIGIASGLSTDAGGVTRYLARTGFAAPIVIDNDGALFRRFGVRSFPTVIELDPAGRPARRLDIAQIDALAPKTAS